MRVPARGLGAAIALFVADQLSKWAVTGPLGIDHLGASQDLTGFFSLRFVPNIGVSLGLLSADSDATRWALVAMTGLIAAGVGLTASAV